MLDTSFPGDRDRTPRPDQEGGSDSRNGSDSKAIIIHVEKAEPVCFIATPFAQEHDRLSDLVGRAVSDFGLTSSRADWNPKDSRFAVGIMRSIRSAEIVVAVCDAEISSEPGSTRFNPNVMYELGIAHSLGKPTLILSSDPRQLPANLAGLRALTYSPEKLQKESYAASLVLEIRDEVRRLMDGHHEDWSGISVAPSRQMIFLDDSFIQDFRRIAIFGRDLRRVLMDINNNHLDVLLREITKVPLRSLEELFEFSKVWEKYEDAYRQNHRELLDTSHKSWKQIEDCFDRLPRKADEDVKDKIATCRDFHKEIKKSLGDYPESHRELAKMVDELLESHDNPGKVFGKIRSVSILIKGCILQTDGLIVNLMMMV